MVVMEASRDATATTKKKKATCTGSPHYRYDDIAKLLNIVEGHQPIGNNDWCLVASHHNEYAISRKCPKREAESVKEKFDRIESTKKLKGDPLCPIPMHRAQNIAHNIFSRVNAISVGDEISDDEDDSIDLVGDTSSGLNYDLHEDKSPSTKRRSKNTVVGA